MENPMFQLKLTKHQVDEIMGDALRQIEMKRLSQLEETQKQNQSPFLQISDSSSKPSIPSMTIGQPISGPVRPTAAEMRALLFSKIAAVEKGWAANNVLNRNFSSGAALASSSSETSQKSLPKPAPLILDHEGRTIDITGKEVQLTQRKPTLKANIRAQERKQFKLTTQERTHDEIQSRFYDPSVQAKPPSRPKRGLKFNEPGTYIKLGSKIRDKAKLEVLQKEIAKNAMKTGIASAARFTLLSSIVPKKENKEDDIPDIEWWDEYVLTDSSYEASINSEKPLEEKYEGITHLIEHPMQMKPPGEPNKIMPLPVFLTKKERKKLRRQNRREAWKEKQEKIRLGLEPPPEPKVKMSNMMKVLGEQAIKDPTKVEAQVREQMDKRKKAHEEANAARKLTVDQKRQKKVKKVKEDTSLGVHVAVYRVFNLTNQSKKFKIETNAKQLLMTGVIVLFKNVNVVVVEGGPSQQKKFKRLMLDRIKWNEELVPVESDSSKKVENSCSLVWEGMVKNRAFGEIRFKNSPNESFARELFKNHGVEHYWDLSYSLSILNN